MTPCSVPSSRPLFMLSLACLACLIAACGGSGEDAAQALSAPADVGSRKTALAPPPLTILEHPASARVGYGAGVEFTLSAKPISGNSITGYQWWRDGQRFAFTRSPRLVIANATASGSYTVEVQSAAGNLTSKKATLSVVRYAWAELGGRPVATSAATTMKPSLTLCDAPTLAWVEHPKLSNDRIRVSRFNGSAWVGLSSAPVNNPATADATEPSIACGDAAGAPTPAVAYSEADGPATRAIRVRRWDGTQWLDVGSASLPGTVNARRPLLSLAPANGAIPMLQHLRTRSAVAWSEPSLPVASPAGINARIALWDGLAWQRRGAWPVSGLDLSLALDLDTRSGPTNDYPPLLLSLDEFNLRQNKAVALGSTQHGFRQQVAATASPVVPISAVLQPIGVGYGRDISGGGAVAVWRTPVGADDVIRSSRLFGLDYSEAMRTPVNQPAWQPFAEDLLVRGGLVAGAWDGTEWSSGCIGSAPGFGLAFSDGNAVAVRVSDCPYADPRIVWRPVTSVDLQRPAVELALRMAAHDDPVLATVESSGGVASLSVWKFYR